MKDILVALLAGGVGLALLFAGYQFARLFLPLLGFISGLSLGAAIAADMTNKPFLGSLVGLSVGLLFGIVFALFAYLYYALAIVILGVSLGYWIGSEFMLLLGFSPGVISVVSGVVLGAFFGLLAIVLRAPKYVLVVATAFAGAITLVGGVMLLTQQIALESFSYATANAAISNGFLWTLLTLGLAVVGIAVQSVLSSDYTLEEWHAGDTHPTDFTTPVTHM